MDALAAVGRECLCALDNLVPLLFRQSLLDGFTGNIVFHHSIHQSCIEVIACSDGADRFGSLYRILFLYHLCTQHHRISPLSIDKVLAVERNLCIKHLIGIILLEQYLEVLLRATHDISQLEILQEVRL